MPRMKNFIRSEERLRKWLRFFKSLAVGLPFEEVASLGENQCVPTAIQRITGKNGKDVQVALAALSIRIGDCGSTYGRALWVHVPRI